VDILLVGLFLSTRDVAIYTVASRYALIATFALQAMGVAIAPQVSGLFAQHKRSEAESVYQFSTGWIVLFSWPALVLLAEFSGVFMRLFGAPYVSGATTLAILAAGMLAYTGTGSNGLVLLMSGRSGWNLLSTVLALGLNIGLNLILIPTLGIEGAAISWTITLCFVSALTALLLYRFERIAPLSRPLGAAVLATAGVAAAGFAGRVLIGDTVAGLVVSLGVGMVLFGLVTWNRRRILNLSALRLDRRQNRPVAAV
jgi:O-antigen/teichoic acid export membrane protein